MIFVTDADSRPAGAAHPLSNLWDNGTDPLAQLAHVMNVLDMYMNMRRFHMRHQTMKLQNYLSKEIPKSSEFIL